MILTNWLFMLLLMGVSKATTENETNATGSFENCADFDRCFGEFLNMLPQAIVSKELHVSDEMKEDIVDCMESETERCGLLGFVDLFGSSEEIEDSCGSTGGCSDVREDELEYPKENKYSFLHCMDEHMRDLMECMSHSFIDTIRDFITMPNIEENFSEQTVMCSIVQSFLPCTREVSIQSCGKDGSDLVRREIEREHKDMLDACDEILIFKFRFVEKNKKW